MLLWSCCDVIVSCCSVMLVIQSSCHHHLPHSSRLRITPLRHLHSHHVLHASRRHLQRWNRKFPFLCPRCTRARYHRQSCVSSHCTRAGIAIYIPINIALVHNCFVPPGHRTTKEQWFSNVGEEVVVAEHEERIWSSLLLQVVLAIPRGQLRQERGVLIHCVTWRHLVRHPPALMW